MLRSPCEGSLNQIAENEREEANSDKMSDRNIRVTGSFEYLDPSYKEQKLIRKVEHPPPNAQMISVVSKSQIEKKHR